MKSLRIRCQLYLYSIKRAAEIAVSTVREWMAGHSNAVERVIFNVFKDEDRKYYEELIQ